MGKIHEIIESGTPPGAKIGEGALDPGSPEAAVPKAFRKLEEKHSAHKIAKDAGFSISRIKQAWSMCLALLLLPSGVMAGDISKGYTFIAGDTVTHVKLNNAVDLATINTSFFTDKSALAPASSDTFLYYSASAAGFRKTTLSTLLLANTSLITGQSEDTTPVGGDFLLTYDVSATSLKKTQLDSLVFTNNALINGRTETNTPSATAAYFLMQDGTAYRKVARSNIFYEFASFAFFTNLTAFNAPTNQDRLWLYDSAAGANKTITLAALVTNSAVAAAVTAGDMVWGFSTNDNETVKYTVQQIKTYTTNDTALARTNQLPGKFTSLEYFVTNGLNTINTNHGLAGTPQHVYWVLVCKTNEIGYDVGDEVNADGAVDSSNSDRHPNTGASSSNAFLSFGPAGNVRISNKTNPAAPAALNASGAWVTNWKWKGYATYQP